MLAGTLVLGAATILASRVTALWHLYVVVGVFTAVGVLLAVLGSGVRAPAAPPLFPTVP